MEKLKTLPRSKINLLPKATGVYLFYEKNKAIYIGKAINIKNRVRNHFQQPTYKDNFFIEKVEKIGFIKTNSEIEALILEANLIKKYQPKFNQAWRDDKNYFYVAIVKNKGRVPCIYITHQLKLKTNLFTNSRELVNQYKSKAQYIGPFVEGAALKKTLKFLRKVFPFYTSPSHPLNKCPWCHLDLCPGPAPDFKKYRKDIKKLILILRGKRKTVLISLKKEMKAFSSLREFENASKIRDQILALKNIMSHAYVISHPAVIDDRPLSKENDWPKTEGMLRRILDIDKPISRIECYDVSNIQGKQATGAMAVFTNGRPDKNHYRKFKIKIINKPNDIAMLKEVLERRLTHPEWQYPEVILIDGGIAQLNVAIKSKSKREEAKSIKIVSIAKRFKELFIESRGKPILLKTLPQEIYNLIIHLDDEAHRFAIAYHKKLRKKALLY